MRLLRITLYLLTVGVLATLGVTYRARAYADERMLGLGRQLALLATGFGDDAANASETLRVNGIDLEVAAGVSDLPLSVLLDRFHARCLRPELGAWAAAKTAPVLSDADPDGGVLRGRMGGEGYVACLQHPDMRRATHALDWARRFIADGRLRTPGALRYMMARALPGRVRYVTVRSAQPIDLSAALPHAGDAPHAPYPWPRPEGSRLWLSGDTMNNGARLALFIGPERVERALGRYARRLQRAGFSVRAAGNAGTGGSDFSARRGAVQLHVSGVPRGDASAIVVTQWPADRTAHTRLTADAAHGRTR